MKDVKLYQDNRLTTARYELSLMEKRIMYVLIRDIRQKFVLSNTGDTTLFEDLIIKTTSGKLLDDLKETNPERVKKAFRSLRLRSFEWDNGLDVGDENYEGFEVGFINYSIWRRGGDIEFQVSKLLLPFFVELTKKYTEYSLVVAIGLKSKWSQRMYELCSKWKVAGGFQMTVKELRKEFVLEKKYQKYGSLRKYVLDVAYKELKELYKKDECDLYFEFIENKSGRSVTGWSFKIITNVDKSILTTADIDYFVRTDLHSIFETKTKPKNKEFVSKVLTVARLKPELLEHLYKRIKKVKKLDKSEQAPYLRFIINKDIL